jgi:hypothetical protein
MNYHALTWTFLLLASTSALASQPWIPIYEITDIECAEAHGIAVSVWVSKNPYGSPPIIDTTSWVLVPDRIEGKPFIETSFGFDYEGQNFIAALKKREGGPGLWHFDIGGTNHFVLNGKYVVSYEKLGFQIYLKPLHESILERGHSSDSKTKYERDVNSIASLEGCGTPRE